MEAIRYQLRILFGKNVAYTLINIIGLSLGITSVIMALLFAKDEFEFDKFHSSHQNIYRIVVDWKGDGVERNWARSSPPISEMIKDAIPQIDPIVKIRKNPGTDLFTIGEKDFYEPGLFLADEDFFKLFGFELKVGEPNQVLEDKFSLVITESAAMRYFDDPNPVGKMILYDNKYNLTITGIARDCPKNTHLQFNMVAINALLQEIFNERRLSHWGQFDYYTYGRIAEGQSVAQLQQVINSTMAEYAPDWVSEKMQLSLQSIASIHLSSDRHSELTPNSSETFSYVFLGIALLILFMAVFNYLNMALSLLIKRQKEISLRLALGSGRLRIFKLIISESVMTIFSAGIVSILIVYFTTPVLEQITGKVLTENLSFSDWGVLLTLLLTVGFAAGVLPALFALNHLTDIARKPSLPAGRTLRNFIFISQISVSTLLLIGVLVGSRQLTFLYQQSLGFSDDQVLIIPIKDRSHNANYQTISQSLNSIAGVELVSLCSTTPGTNNSLTYTYTFEGSERGETPMAVVIADENYIPLYQMELTLGRLPDGRLDKEVQDIIINQAAVDMLQLQKPLGTTVTGKTSGKVVGVVKDFQLNSLHNAPEPMIMYNYLPTLRYVSLKLKKQEQHVIEQIEKMWANFYPEYPMEYTYLQEDNQKLYSFEKGVQSALKILQPISMLLIAIGMMAFTFLLASEKAKEFAIRQSLGGNSLNIVTEVILKMSSSFVISCLISVPLGYFSIKRWFENFQYHTPITVDLLILPLIGIISLITLIMGVIIINQIRQSPVKYLRIID